MGSLSAHLRQPEDHGRLAFHPECPVCRRERLVGALPAEAVVSRRTQALLAAGVLALSTAAPTAVLAAEPDQEQQGTAAPGQIGQHRSADSPDFDPGGASTDLPFDAGPAPDAPASPDPDDDAARSNRSRRRTPTRRWPTRATVPATGRSNRRHRRRPQSRRRRPRPPSRHPIPPRAQPRRRQRRRRPLHRDTDAVARRAREPRKRDDARGEDEATETRAQTTALRHASATPVAIPSAASSPNDGPSDTEPAERQARRGGRAEGERRAAATASTSSCAGESLWSIANDLLGDRASAARIAREVNRLWELNSDRIATGDRDLLMVGTRLALR